MRKQARRSPEPLTSLPLALRDLGSGGNLLCGGRRRNLSQHKHFLHHHQDVLKYTNTECLAGSNISIHAYLYRRVSKPICNPLSARHKVSFRSVQVTPWSGVWLQGSVDKDLGSIPRTAPAKRSPPFSKLVTILTSLSWRIPAAFSSKCTYTKQNPYSVQCLACLAQQHACLSNFKRHIKVTPILLVLASPGPWA